MIGNYKIDLSNEHQPEIQLIGTSGKYNTWRIYFLVEELEPRVETKTVYEEVHTGIPEPEPNVDSSFDGSEDKTVVSSSWDLGETHTVSRVIEYTVRTFKAKYVDVEKHISIVNPDPVELLKEVMFAQIDVYDKSEEVNSFFLNGAKVWLDKDTRVGLMNSISIQKQMGMENTTLWLNTTPFTLNCGLALQLLGALEIYACECFNKTAEHKLGVQLLGTLDEVASYDFKQGYPEKLNLTV